MRLRTTAELKSPSGLWGAKASATTYSIVESAKENGLKPFEYLTYLFTELPNATTKALDEFLPWSESLPDNCRIPSK